MEQAKDESQQYQRKMTDPPPVHAFARRRHWNRALFKLWVYHQSGRACGTILAYLVGALIVYLVMLCLGELSVAMPVTGAFHTYATKYIGPGTGYTIAWLYWLTWTVALGSEFTAAGSLMQCWFPDTSVWMWSGVFALLIFLLNAFTVKFFAESEFWFSSIKVMAIILFIILGGAAMFGLIPLKGGEAAPFFSNFTGEGGLFPNGFLPILMTMLAVNFAFSGTELIGIAAGESVNPDHTISRAIRTTVLRLVLFFVGTIVVLAGLIPVEEAGVIKSPFVVVFDHIGIPYAADFMNFVILTAILSAANSGLYASSRMLWSLSEERTLPKKLAKLTSKRNSFECTDFKYDRRDSFFVIKCHRTRNGIPCPCFDLRTGRCDRVDGDCCLTIYVSETFFTRRRTAP